MHNLAYHLIANKIVLDFIKECGTDFDMSLVFMDLHYFTQQKTKFTFQIRKC